MTHDIESERECRSAFNAWPGWKGPEPIWSSFRAGWNAALASHAPSGDKPELFDHGHMKHFGPDKQCKFCNPHSEAAAQPPNEVFAEIDKSAAKRAEIEHNDH